MHRGAIAVTIMIGPRYKVFSIRIRQLLSQRYKYLENGS
jgi:hypothetical protein